MTQNLGISLPKGMTGAPVDHKLFCKKISQNAQVITMRVADFPTCPLTPQHHNVTDHEVSQGSIRDISSSGYIDFGTNLCFHMEHVAL